MKVRSTKVCCSIVTFSYKYPIDVKMQQASKSLLHLPMRRAQMNQIDDQKWAEATSNDGLFKLELQYTHTVSYIQPDHTAVNIYITWTITTLDSILFLTYHCSHPDYVAPTANSSRR